MSHDADYFRMDQMAGPPSSSSSLYNWLEDVLLEERASLHAHLEKRHETVLRRLDLLLARGVGSDGPGPHLPRSGTEPESVAPPPGWGSEVPRSRGGMPQQQHHQQHQQHQQHHQHNQQFHQPQLQAGVPEPGLLELSVGSANQSLESSSQKPLPLQDSQEDPLQRSEAGDSRKSVTVKPPQKHKKKNVLQVEESSGRPRSFKELVMHPGFEVTFVVLIILSAVVVALELQYWGYDAGLLVGHPSAVQSADEAWPWAREFFDVIAPIFGFAFVVELCLKILGLRLQFFFSALNLFDLLVVVLWLLDYFKLIESIADPVIMRLVRLARVMRLLKVVRYMQGLDQLLLIVASVQGSMSILCWSTVILTAVMIFCALFVTFSVRDFIEDDTRDNLDARLDVFKFFGSFTRAMLTMFEVTLGNWIPPCRSLMEHISETYAALFIIYKCVVGFAVVKVITGVFMCETFKVASTNDEIMIMQKTRAKQKHLTKMKTLFSAADAEGDGKVGWEEFQQIMLIPRVKAWLGAMELDVGDAYDLFRLLDDGDHEVSLEELATGITKLKGASRSMDLHLLMHDHRAMAAQIEHCAKTEDLRELHQAIFQLQAWLSRSEAQTPQSDPGLSQWSSPATVHAAPSVQRWHWGANPTRQGSGGPGPRPEPPVAPISPNIRMQQDRQRMDRERRGRRAPARAGDPRTTSAQHELRDVQGAHRF